MSEQKTPEAEALEQQEEISEQELAQVSGGATMVEHGNTGHS